MKKIEPTPSGHHQQAFISTAIPQPPHKAGKPVTSTPSTSMLMAAEHDAAIPHNMLTKSQNQSVTTPGVGIPYSHVMLPPHHSPPISIQTHSSIVTPAVIQTPSGDSSKNEPRNTAIGAAASGNLNTAHSPRPAKPPGRKRKLGPDIPMEASKRSPPMRDREESRESGPNSLPPLPPSLLVNAKPPVSKQMLEEFMPPNEGKEKIKMESLPEGFDYDPYLPMSKELQLLSFENQQLARQKKFEYQQQQQMAIEQLRKEEQSAKMKAAKPRPRKQPKSSEISNPSHLGLPPSSSHILAVTSPPTPPQNKGLSRQMAHPALAQGSVITSQENTPQVYLTPAGMMIPQVKTESQSLKLSNTPGGKPPAASLSPKQPQPRKPSAKRPDPLQIKTEGGGEHLPQPGLWPHMASHSFQHAAAFTPIQSTHAHSGSHSTSNTTAINMPLHGTNAIPISAHPLAAATSSAHPWSTVVTSSAISTEKSTRQDHHIPLASSVISSNEHPHHSSHVDRVSPSVKNKQDWHPSEGHGHSHGFTPVISSSSSHHVSGAKPTSAPPSSHSYHSQPAAHHHHHHHHRHQAQAAANGTTRREGAAPSSSRHGSTFPTNTSSGEKQPHVHHHHHQGASSSTSSSSSSSHASLSSSQSSRSHNKTEQSASQLQQQQQQAHAQQLQQAQVQQLQQLQLSAMQQQLQLSPNAFAQRQQNGLPSNPAMIEEWMKQMQLMQMHYAEMVKNSGGGIPIGHSELQAAQQTQMAQMAAAAAQAQVGISVDPSMAMAALLYQQQQQQQQQQQSAEALANLQAAGAQNMIHLMHPAMAAAPAAHHPAALAGLYDPGFAFGE